MFKENFLDDTRVSTFTCKVNIRHLFDIWSRSPFDHLGEKILSHFDAFNLFKMHYQSIPRNRSSFCFVKLCSQDETINGNQEDVVDMFEGLPYIFCKHFRDYIESFTIFECYVFVMDRLERFVWLPRFYEYSTKLVRGNFKRDSLEPRVGHDYNKNDGFLSSRKKMIFSKPMFGDLPLDL